MARRQVIISLAAAVVLVNPTAAIAQPGPLVPDPAGLISFPAGYSYTNLITSCVTPATSTESGVTFPYPDDPDGNVLFQGPRGETWLLEQRGAHAAAAG